MLGGNIGVPIVERLPELTAEHRVVYELSELQLPTLSRGTTVAVYTNVTSDHLDRHGSLERYRAAKRRLAELVDPTGALVLNAEDPVVAAYADLGRAPVVSYRRGAPPPGGLGVVDGWIVADGVERLALAGGGPAATGPDGRIMPVDELAIPGAHNVSNALAAVAVGLLFGVAPEAIREAAAAFGGVEHRLEPVARRSTASGSSTTRRGRSRTRSSPRCARSTAPIVLIAGGRDKGIDLSGLGPVVAERAVAAVLIGESGPDLERAVPGRRPGPDGARRLPGGRRPGGRRAGPRGPRRAAWTRRGRDRADRPAQPGCRQLRHVHRLRGPRRRLQGGRRPARRRAPAGEGPMNLAPPIRTARTAIVGPRRRSSDEARRTANREPGTDQAGQVLQRERHQADYVILVVVVALTAVGILMVYSSSAIRGYLSADADTFATVGPQIQWAVLGIGAMAAMMRVDYRYLRLVSVPFFAFAIVLLVRRPRPAMVHTPDLGRRSARWLQLGPLPAIHPAEIAKLALVIYLAHWFAKRGTRVGGPVGRHARVPDHHAPDRRARLQGARPGHDDGHHGDRVHDVLRRRCEHVPSRRAMGASALVAMISSACARTRWTGSGRGSTPGPIRSATGSTPSRACSRWASAGCSGAGSGRARSRSRMPSTTSCSPRSARSSAWSAAAWSSCCSSTLAYSGIRVSLRAPDTFGALLAAGITGWLCIQAFINIGVVVALFPITGITLPVHQRRRLVAHHQLRRGRDPAVDLARDHREGDLERRCDR